MNNTLNALFDDLTQLQAVLGVTAVALDEGTPKHNVIIGWGALFTVTANLTQSALSKVEKLQDMTLEMNAIDGGEA